MKTVFVAVLFVVLSVLFLGCGPAAAPNQNYIQAGYGWQCRPDNHHCWRQCNDLPSACTFRSSAFCWTWREPTGRNGFECYDTAAQCNEHWTALVGNEVSVCGEVR